MIYEGPVVVAGSGGGYHPGSVDDANRAEAVSVGSAGSR